MEVRSMDLTREELNALPDGSLVQMGCMECEGGEMHKKVDGEWICQWHTKKD